MNKIYCPACCRQDTSRHGNDDGSTEAFRCIYCGQEFVVCGDTVAAQTLIDSIGINDYVTELGEKLKTAEDILEAYADNIADNIATILRKIDTCAEDVPAWIIEELEGL